MGLRGCSKVEQQSSRGIDDDRRLIQAVLVHVYLTENKLFSQNISIQEPQWLVVIFILAILSGTSLGGLANLRDLTFSTLACE